MRKFLSIWELNTPTDLMIYDDILFWSEVEKADGYVVKVDDREYTVLAGTRFCLKTISLGIGIHKVAVKALGYLSIADNTMYRDSDYCKEVDYRLSINYKYMNRNKLLNQTKNAIGL